MTTLRAGVIGWPVEHSKSPRLHGYWLRQHGVDGDYTHVPAPPETFAETVARLRAKGWRGANVTIPHKEAALALADRTTDRARAIGAANTLVFSAEGIEADNTDAFGFTENLAQSAGAAWRRDGVAVVLGAGGAARAAVWALLDAGAAEVRIVNRTLARAEALAADLGPGVAPHEWTDIAAALKGAHLVANTTSLGMKGQPPLEIDLSPTAPGAVATDAVYTPLDTPFLQTAAAAGLTTVDGLGMLLHQARPGFQAWFGPAPQVDADLRALMLAP